MKPGRELNTPGAVRRRLGVFKVAVGESMMTTTAKHGDLSEVSVGPKWSGTTGTTGTTVECESSTQQVDGAEESNRRTQ